MTAAGIWTAYEAAAATGGALCARGGAPGEWPAEEWTASGVSIDTRTLAAGDMFVALAGQRDGHEFVKAAFAAGAAAALVSRPPDDAPAAAPLIVVDDTLAALRRLARAARLRNFGMRIAVTGSAGKTSVKEMLRTALSASGAVHAADKSFNNHIGVPLTIARMPMRADFTVIEIGMNHRGEIEPLTRLARPHAAIITTVAEAHLENLGTIENIAEEKADIFLGLESDGSAILPIDNPHFPRLRERALAAGAGRVLTFGRDARADLRLLEYSEQGDKALIRASILGAPATYRLGALGVHQAVNSLATLAGAIAIGASGEAARDALADHAPAEGRGARRQIAISGGGAATLIDESYNANPTSMAAALATLAAARPRGRGRRIAVLGDMLELGPDGPALHAGLAAALENARVERLYVAGPLMQNLWDAAPASMRAGAARDAEGLVAAVAADLADGDIVMVKGSNGSRISLVARALEQGETAARSARAGKGSD